MRIPFQEWLPDAAPFLAPGSPTMLNVQPDVGRHNPFPALSAVSSNALSAKCQGAFSAQGLDGTVFTFAGDATKLYSYSAGAWSDVTRVSGGAYTLTSDDVWSFTQFGQYVIATSGTDNVQVWNMGSSSHFADLAGSPPKAKYAATIRDFVVLANTPGTAPQTVTWSGFENSTDWSTANNNQSDSQTLYGNGPIMGISAGDGVAYIFQRHAITRMTYVGSPVIFQFDTVTTNVGLGAQGSLIRVGNMMYFWDNGFWSFDGSQLQPIGLGKWDQWFNANANPSSLTQMTAAFDPARKMIYWGFVSVNASGLPDLILGYNYATKAAAPIQQTHEILFNGLTSGMTMDAAAFQTLVPNLDLLTTSLDSPQWQGGAYQLLAFDSTHSLATFSGSNLAAILTTPEFEAVPSRRSRLINARPLTDTSSASIQVNSRARLSDTATSTIDAAMQDNGDCPILADGRYHVAELNIPAGTAWTYAQGIEFDAVDGGLL